MKKQICLLCISIGILALAQSAQAGPIYVYKEADGAIRFTSKRPPEGVKAKVFTAKGSKFSHYSSTSSRSRRPKYYPKDYDVIIKAASRQYKVDEALIRAVIHVESAFNKWAVSRKGALGLMQLMPFNVRKYKVGDPFVARNNIRGGVKMLAKLIKQYKGDLQLALAAYNAGEGAVEKYGGIPPYSETVHYVRRVLRMQKKYQALLYG